MKKLLIPGLLVIILILLSFSFNAEQNTILSNINSDSGSNFINNNIPIINKILTENGKQQEINEKRDMDKSEDLEESNSDSEKKVDLDKDTISQDEDQDTELPQDNDIPVDNRDSDSKNTDIKEPPSERESINDSRSLLDEIKEYQVQRGDNLSKIASKHDIDIDTIIGANDINDINNIKPGDTLKILPVKGIIYKINPGENLWSVSRKYNISKNKIIEANNLSNPDLIKPGKNIIIPGIKPEIGYNERINKVNRDFIEPVTNARISSYYGMRWGRMHEGIDYAVSTGTEVKASRAGTVIFSDWATGYGHTVVIEHQKGVRTLYAHNSELLVNGGQNVSQGEVIALSGNSGRSTGPHLHFEIQINGKAVNPLSYL